VREHKQGPPEINEAQHTHTLWYSNNNMKTWYAKMKAEEACLEIYTLFVEVYQQVRGEGSNSNE